MLVVYSFDWDDFKFLKLFKNDEEEKARELILKICKKIKGNKEGKGGCLVWFSDKSGLPVSRQNYIYEFNKWEEKYDFKKGEG